MAARGGKRPGAGRKKGSPNKSTADVKALALQYVPAAFERLAAIIASSESQAAQVAASKEILDRAFGKAPQAIIGDKANPIEVAFSFKLDRPT